MQRPLLAVALLAAAASGQDTDAPPGDDRLREAWSYLTPTEQVDAMAWLRADAPYLGTFQAELLAHALTLAEVDAGLLPLDVETPFFDPELHAPGQPIPRRRLDPDDSAAVRTRERMFARVPDTGLVRAWRYDWGSGRVVRLAEADDPERTFENALRGFPPDLDLAQALVERTLDDGALRDVHAAFGHAYTDRAGRVFPGVTLYGAWASGTEIEMPDVDCLGVVHSLDNEWKRWVAPVPERLHDPLYEHVGEHFSRARRHRGLRTALATTYLVGGARLRDGYPAHLDRLHSLWDRHASDPAELARILPTPEGWAGFLEAWSIEVDRSLERTQAGQARRATLERDAAAVRGFLIRILGELGAMERESRPPPAPKEEADGSTGRSRY